MVIEVKSKTVIKIPRVISKLKIASAAMVLWTLCPQISVANNSSVKLESTVTNSNYPAKFFDQYNPQNAFEMIERLPGFSFDGGSQARGFGGNAGNVLIDAARPTSKSSGLEGVLKRIPADQVVRIELLRSGSEATEAQGQSLVANIIRRQIGTSGTWASSMHQNGSSAVEPNLEATVSAQLGEWNTSFDLDIGTAPNQRTAILDNIKDISQVISQADENRVSVDRRLIVSGEAARSIADGKLTLNGRFVQNNIKNDTQRNISTADYIGDEQFDKSWRLGETDKTKSGEFGIDWIKTEDQWKWRSISLATVEDRAYKNKTTTSNSFNIEHSESRYEQDYLSTEFIARSTLTKIAGSKFKPEYGLEIAKNQLDTEFRLGDLTSEASSNINLENSGGDITVEELRAELFANFNYSFDESLTLEGGLTLELSKIDVSGDADAQQTFQYLKPRLAATYKIDDTSSLNFEVVYRVSQLNFNDFAASNEASDQNITSGNPNLEPDKRTDLSLIYDWSFSERGSLKVEGFYSFRYDKLEQIILSTDNEGNGQHGLGNAGDGRSWGLNTNISLPLDKIIDNGLIEITHQYFHSSLFDPIIGTHRKVTDSSPNWLFFKFRQDLVEQKFAWGLEYSGNSFNTIFRVDERILKTSNKRLRLFVETSNFFGVKTQLEISEANGGRYKRSRFFYENDRSGKLLGSEVSRQKYDPEIKFSISGTF